MQSLIGSSTEIICFTHLTRQASVTSADVQKCRGSEVHQRCRGAGCAGGAGDAGGASVHVHYACRCADVQRWRGADVVQQVQMCRGAGGAGGAEVKW